MLQPVSVKRFPLIVHCNTAYRIGQVISHIGRRIYLLRPGLVQGDIKTDSFRKNAAVYRLLWRLLSILNLRRCRKTAFREDCGTFLEEKTVGFRNQVDGLVENSPNVDEHAIPRAEWGVFMGDVLSRVIHGGSVLVPDGLLRSIRDVSRGGKGRDVAALLWSYIHQRNSGGSFSISNEELCRVASAGTETVNNAKAFLEERGFIEVDHSYAAGIRSKRYEAIGTPLVEYELTTISPTDASGRYAQAEACCEYTRSVLDRLDFDAKSFHAAFEARTDGNFDEFDRIFPTVYPVARIVQRGGRVFRDRTGRLHSPFTQLYSSFRSCFTIAGQPLASVDMRACQPTLLGLVSGDDQLVEDAASDALYGEIAATLECSRKEAKANYCWFAYGSVKTKETATNRPAFLIQKMFESRYPNAYRHVIDHKQTDYRRFSIEMMKLESRIFIDGVLNDLGRAGLECLGQLEQ